MILISTLYTQSIILFMIIKVFFIALFMKVRAVQLPVSTLSLYFSHEECAPFNDRNKDFTMSLCDLRG